MPSANQPPGGSLHTGDATGVLREHIESGSVDLVYLDPPFKTGSTRRGRRRHTGVVTDFADTWPDLDSYLSWLRGVLTEAHRVLKPSGAVMVHCDWRVNHHIRVLLDETFGADSFRNEIIWHYRRWTANQTSLQRLHQTIWYYARSPSHETDVPMVEYSPTTNLDQIWQARTRNEDNIAVYDRDASGTRNSGAKRGVPMGDVWDMPYLNPKATERVGYPTQKPVHLLERLISLSTGPGDLVVDPCCGSGTTLVAAELLDRRWIGIDANPDAIALSRERTRAPHKSVSRVLADGREGFVASTPNGVEATLDLLGAHRVQRNAVIHGYLSPSGLRALGIPDSWSVPVYIEPAVAGPSCQQLPQFVRAMRRKQADLGLYLTSQMPDPPTKAPRGAVVAKVPATEQDLRMLRLQLQRLPLPTPQREHQTS